MQPLETYLRELRDIRSLGAGVKETSYYPACLGIAAKLPQREVRIVVRDETEEERKRDVHLNDCQGVIADTFRWNAPADE